MNMSNGVTGGVFATLADMKASLPRDNTKVQCSGLGDAVFIKQPSGYSALPGDITLNSGGILALVVGSIANIEWFGVTLDGVTDDLASLQNAFDRGIDLNGSPGKIRITGEVVMKNGTSFSGAGYHGGAAGVPDPLIDTIIFYDGGLIYLYTS